MVDTLRHRANMEMIDVFKNINRQVFDREKQQVAVFPMKNEPKTQRDLGVEVNTDKSIEQLNRLLETKLGALEAINENLGGLIRGIPSPSYAVVSTSKKSQAFQAYQAVTNTGDVLPLWNQISRYYQTQGLARDSQQIVKTKVQELKPNLDAILYGIKGVIDYLFSNNSLADLRDGNTLKILQLLRTQSVYGLISKQLDFEPDLISVPVLESAYKNSFDSLSANQIRIIKDSAPHQNILKQNISNMPINSQGELERRLKAIQDEMGFRFPSAYLKELVNMPIDKASVELDKIRQEKKPSPGEQKEINSIDTLLNEKDNIIMQEIKASVEYQTLLDSIEELETSPLNLGQYPQENLPQIPIQPRRRTLKKPYTQQQFDDREKEFKDAMDIWTPQITDYRAINARNRVQKENAEAKSKDERDELIRERRQDLDDLELMWNEIRARASINDEALKNIKFKINFVSAPLSASLSEYAKANPITFQGMGKGAPVDTRGLATMRDNYGAPESDEESDGSSDSDKEFMDFDDKRNEHYTSRPY